MEQQDCFFKAVHFIIDVVQRCQLLAGFMFVLNVPADNASPIAYTLCRLLLPPGPWEILQEMNGPLVLGGGRGEASGGLGRGDAMDGPCCVTS